MTNFTYKAKNGGDFFLPGIGASKNGTITLSGEIESNALELVSDTDATQPAPQEAVTNNEQPITEVQQ